MSIMNFIGYRGTRKKWTDQILNSGADWRNSEGWKWSVGEDEYFGHGIYFFEEDHLQAFNFAKNRRNYPEKDITIIRMEISCDTKYILDFFDSAVYEEYINIVKKELHERLNGDDDMRWDPSSNVPLDCVLINFACRKQGYKLVRGIYESDFQKGYFELAKSLIAQGVTRILPLHIELCVKDENLFKDYSIICNY